MWRCGCIVIFKDSEVRDVIDNGSRVRSTFRRFEGNFVLEEGLAFHGAPGWHAVYSGFRGQSGCIAACAQPDHHVELETHLCSTPLYSGTRKKERNIGYLYTIRISACGFLDKSVDCGIIRFTVIL